ncbi:MAG: hypothetical protein GY835_22210 [bacterium]|nr:hypothetical protein [bacterium]
MRKHFRPEFWNRLAEVVTFRNLSLADVDRIVELEVASAMRRAGFVRRSNIGLVVEDAARPLRRVIEERVITPVAGRLAADPQLRDWTIRVVGSSGHSQEDYVIVLTVR